RGGDGTRRDVPLPYGAGGGQASRVRHVARRFPARPGGGVVRRGREPVRAPPARTRGTRCGRWFGRRFRLVRRRAPGRRGWVRRGLRPGGYLQFADIANGKPVPPEALRDIDLWTG